MKKFVKILIFFFIKTFLTGLLNNVLRALVSMTLKEISFNVLILC